MNDPAPPVCVPKTPDSDVVSGDGGDMMLPESLLDRMPRTSLLIADSKANVRMDEPIGGIGVQDVVRGAISMWTRLSRWAAY